MSILLALLAALLALFGFTLAGFGSGSSGTGPALIPYASTHASTSVTVQPPPGASTGGK